MIQFTQLADWLHFCEKWSGLHCKTKNVTRVLVFCNYAAFLNMIYSISTAGNLIDFLMKMTQMVGILPFLGGALYFISARQKFLNLLEWLEVRRQFERNNFMVPTAKRLYDKLADMSVKRFKFVVLYFWFFGIFFEVVCLLIYANITGGKNLPLESQFPLLSIDTWFGYLINEIHQIATLILIVNSGAAAYATYWVAALAIMANIEIVTALIKQIGNSSNDSPRFCDTIKTAVVVHVDVIKRLKELIEISRFSFTAIEFAFFFDTYLFWIVIFLERSAFSLALSRSGLIPLYFCICTLSEQIRDKFEKLAEALYETPWYELPPKQRRALLLIITQAQTVKGLNSAGLYEITFDRLEGFMNKLYSSLLVLQKLLKNYL